MRARSTPPASPASKGRLDPHITSAFTSGATTGTLSAEDRAWFVSRGPGDLVKQITVPTFLVEGTADTLFTLRGGDQQLRDPKANGVPAKMMWFCGGHGVCLTGAGPGGPHRGGRRRLAEALRRPATPRSTPARASSGSPTTPSGARPPTTRRRRARRSSRPAPARSRSTPPTPPRARSPPPAAPPTPSTSPSPPPPRRPRSSASRGSALTYTAPAPATHVFAQIVDEARGVVVGNQATPIPLTLDGQPHTIARPLEAIAASAPAGAKYTLQLTGGTQLYGPVRGAAAITFSARSTSRCRPPARTPSGRRRACSRRPAPASPRRRFTIRVRGAHPR